MTTERRLQRAERNADRADVAKWELVVPVTLGDTPKPPYATHTTTGERSDDPALVRTLMTQRGPVELTVEVA
jgi:hypothetical protein